MVFENTESWSGLMDFKQLSDFIQKALHSRLTSPSKGLFIWGEPARVAELARFRRGPVFVNISY
jgi:hypothetical protein